MPLNLNHTAEELRLLRDPRNTTKHRQDYDDKFKYDVANIRPHHIDNIVEAIYEDIVLLSTALVPINLDDIQDVVLTGPQVNDMLVYDGTNWVNQPAPSSTVITQLDPVIAAQNTPPGSPSHGDRYLITAAPVGLWAGHPDFITEWDSGAVEWVMTTPVTDNTVYVTNTLTTYRYNGTAWVQFQGTSILQNGNSIGNDIILGSNDNFDVIVNRNASEYLRLGSSQFVINEAYGLPITDGVNGQALITDGAGNVTWGSVSSLPSQGGNNGKFLTTDGSNASWATLSGNVSLFTNDAGYITSAALGPYLTTVTAAATYQTIAGMSNYYLASNPSGYITSAALAPYLTSGTASSTYVPYTGATSNVNLNSRRLIIGTGADPIGDKFAITQNVIGGTYGSITNDHANGITGWIIGQTAGDYLAHQYYGPSRAGNFNGTSIPFANLSTTVTGLASALNGSPYLVGGSILYGITGTTSTNMGYRMDTDGLKIGAINTLHTSLVGSGDIANFYKSQNAWTALRVMNNTNSTAAKAGFQATANATTSSVNLNHYAATFTTNGLEEASSAALFSVNASAGLNIGTFDSNKLAFYTNNTERARFLSTGEFLVGQTALTAAADVANFTKNQNDYTRFRVINTTNGTGGASGIIVGNGSTAFGDLMHTSASFTTSGIFEANRIILRSSLQFNIGTNNNDSVTFWTNNTEKARFLNTGQFLVGRTTVVAAADVANFEKNQNAATMFRIINTTSGTAGSAFIQVDNNSLGLALGYLSAGFSSSGASQANTSLVLSSAPNGLNIATSTATTGNIAFYTNISATIAERARFTADGQFLVGRTTVTAATDIANFEKLQNNNTSLRVINSTDGTSAGASFIASNGIYGMQMGLYNSSFTTNGMLEANSGVLVSTFPNGMNIGNFNSSNLKFWTNNAERGRFLNTGEFLVGKTTLTTATDVVNIYKNQNAVTNVRVTNNTSGTSAAASILASANNDLHSVFMTALSSAYSSSGINVANTAVFGTNMIAGMNVGTTSNTQMSFWTNNVQRATIDANGNKIFTAGALATNATNGFVYIPSCAGIPTGVPTAVTGGVPLVADSTNNKIYAYLGGAWVALN